MKGRREYEGKRKILYTLKCATVIADTTVTVFLDFRNKRVTLKPTDKQALEAIFSY